MREVSRLAVEIGTAGGRRSRYGSRVAGRPRGREWPPGARTLVALRRGERPLPAAAPVAAVPPARGAAGGHDGEPRVLAAPPARREARPQRPRSRPGRERARRPGRGPAGPGDEADVGGRARYRRVTATGTYDDDATVVVRNRSQDGVAGAWLVTPLALADGDAGGRAPGVRGPSAPTGRPSRRAAPDGRGHGRGPGRGPRPARRHRPRGPGAAAGRGRHAAGPGAGRDVGPARARRGRARRPSTPARIVVVPAARAVRGPAPRLRRPVVHLLLDRRRRVPDGAAPGRHPAGQGGRRRRPAGPEETDAELDELLRQGG